MLSPSGAMLIWAGTDDKQLNTMFEVNMVNPESLDSLIEFVKRKDIENSIHKMKESEDFMNELMVCSIILFSCSIMQ